MPLSNGFETMQFMALCMLVIALPLSKRIPFFLPFGLMAAGLALMVSMLGERNPQITTLMPEMCIRDRCECSECAVFSFH